MKIASYMHDSIVDGPGLRFVVFVQGCSRNCPGCHNPETHDPNCGREVTVEELIAEIKKNPLTQGVTISGGEPFDQAKECTELSRAVTDLGMKVWVYTGYTYEQILEKGDFDWDMLLDNTNVLVDGAFIEEQKSYEAKFRGSKNQRIIDVQSSLNLEELVLWEPSERDTEIIYYGCQIDAVEHEPESIHHLVEGNVEEVDLYIKTIGSRKEYRYGPHWVATQLWFEGGYPTPEEAKKAWEAYEKSKHL